MAAASRIARTTGGANRSTPADAEILGEERRAVPAATGTQPAARPSLPPRQPNPPQYPITYPLSVGFALRTITRFFSALYCHCAPSVSGPALLVTVAGFASLRT